MIRAEWRVGHPDRLKRGNPEGVTIALDNVDDDRDLAIVMFTAALDHEIGVALRARELAERAS